MSPRRIVPAVVALLAVTGCKEVTQSEPQPELVIAAFNSFQTPAAAAARSASLPTPNDLALFAAPSLATTTATLYQTAQRKLLEAFVAAGGFPADQAVGLSIPFKRLTWNGDTNQYDLRSDPPSIDPATVTTAGAAATVVVFKIDGASPVAYPVELDPDATSTWAGSAFPGTLALRKVKDGSGSRAWPSGRYVFAVRGGAAGVKTLAGHAVAPDQGIALVIPNLDLSNPQNQPPGGLTPALVAQVEPLRAQLWKPTGWSAVSGRWLPVGAAPPISAFDAVKAVIPPEEIAAIGTFAVAPRSVPSFPNFYAPIDSSSGIAPLPLDLLRTGNNGQTIGLNSAFGPLAQGLTTLDGFSTTAMVFAPVTFPVDASTVNACNVHLFKLPAGGAPVLLAEFKREAGASVPAGCLPSGAGPTAAAYVIEPDAITTTAGNFVAAGVPCAAARCSVIVGLQPAVGIPGTNFNLPPLEEATDYAVVITTGVHDMAGRMLSKSTVAKILLDPGFDAVATSTINGRSLLSGIPNETAMALMRMRQQLTPVMAALPDGKTSADVALAYTFRTQTVKATARSIVAIPYALPGTTVVADPDALTTHTPAEAATLFGLPPAVLNPAAIAEIDEVKFGTRNMRLPAVGSGAFDPTGATSLEKVKALVAVPYPAAVSGTCPDPTGLGGTAYTAAKCAPLVVFQHGITSSKSSMLPLAAALTSAGFIVAAADLEMHGERSMCTSSAQCAGGSTCNIYPNLQTAVDPAPMGYCESAPGVRGLYASYRADCAAPFLDAARTQPNPACFGPGPAPYSTGTAFTSANRLLTLNFFRVRDAMRQSILDVASLTKAFAPFGKSTDAFAAHLEAQYGLAVDYTKVYFVGHSYGAIAGTLSLAVNPRLTRAVQVAGGATAIDVFANPESSFNAVLVGLLAQSGILPGTSDFLKTLQLGKWVLDPADPANFAQYVTGGNRATLAPVGQAAPALSTFYPTPASRDVLAQHSICDSTVPNAQNNYLAAQLGLTLPATPVASTTGRVQWFSASGGGNCPADRVSHSNLLDFANPSLTTQAQASVAGFLASPADVVTPVLP